jgi:hypothetical protein
MYRAVRASRRIIAFTIDESAGLRRCSNIPPAWPQKMEWKSHEKTGILIAASIFASTPAIAATPDWWLVSGEPGASSMPS